MKKKTPKAKTKQKPSKAAAKPAKPAKVKPPAKPPGKPPGKLGKPPVKALGRPVQGRSAAKGIGAKHQPNAPQQALQAPTNGVERIVEVVAFIAEVYAVNATHVKRIIETHPELLTLFLISLGEITPGVVHRAERHRREVNRNFLAAHNTPKK